MATSGGPDIARQVAERSAIQDALSTLTATDRELLLLCLWDDLSPTDAARVLGITPGTIRVCLHRARHRFRTAYCTRTDAATTGRVPDPIGDLV
jgi:RNA polymerase sigma factor (sigma-70 family)